MIRRCRRTAPIALLPTCPALVGAWAGIHGNFLRRTGRSIRGFPPPSLSKAIASDPTIAILGVGKHPRQASIHSKQPTAQAKPPYRVYASGVSACRIAFPPNHLDFKATQRNQDKSNSFKNVIKYSACKVDPSYIKNERKRHLISE